MSAAIPAATRSRLLVIAWGVFCACSWTWCIGMFLPKIMVERYGAVGFVVFALPNIAGCAGFGYILGNAERSRRLVAEHPRATALFSTVAVAFHLFFAALIASMLDPSGGIAWRLGAPVALFAAGLALSLLRGHAWLAAAAVTYVISLAAFASADIGVIEMLRDRPADAIGALAWITPVIVLGFLLCPLFDLTFHRALQQSPSRHSFAVFAVTFAVMIVLTLFVWFGPEPLRAIALAHLGAQCVFSVGAHLREIRGSSLEPAKRNLALLMPLVALAVFPLAGADGYLRFLVFYSLVFPAYALMFIGPWRPLAVTPRTLAVYAVVVLLLAPAYEIGFLHDRAWALGLPVAVVLAWAIARRR